MNIEEQLKQILKIPVIEERYLELIKLLNKDRDRLMKQNKRYKQALEEIYERLNWGNAENACCDALIIAFKALESDEN